MYDLETVSGRIVEARRYLNRAPRISEHDPSRERWELWLTAPDGGEHKFMVSSGSMPARVGHAVTLVHVQQAPVGLYNLDTGMYVNFTRADPALLLRAADVAVVVFGAFASVAMEVVAGPWVFMLAVPCLALYIPCKAMLRLFARRVLQRDVDALLEQIQTDQVVRPFRRRT